MRIASLKHLKDVVLKTLGHIGFYRVIRRNTVHGLRVPRIIALTRLNTIIRGTRRPRTVFRPTTR